MVKDGAGLFKEYHDNQEVARYGNYQNGFMTGTWVSLNRSGKIISMIEYDDIGFPKWVNRENSTKSKLSQIVVRTDPEFPGGQSAWNKFLRKKIRYPKEAAQLGIQGEVGLTYTVESDGQLSNIRVTKGVHPALDAEAIRIIKASPNWISATKSGRNIDKEITIEIRFRLK